MEPFTSTSTTPFFPTNSTTTALPEPPPSKLDHGDMAMMMFGTTFVMLMIPAAGLAQAGQIRRKNALSMLMQTLVGMCVGSILWYVVGFALVFGDSRGGFIGNPFGSVGFFLRGVSHTEPNTSINANADTIPAILLCVYQLMFAIMTPVIVTGAWAERMSFEAFLIFVTLWPFFVYYPLAHWIWNSDGFLAKWGFLDFAGGVTIHTSSGVAAIPVVLLLAARKNHGKMTQQHHNLPLSALGAVMIFGGWYSFNGCSGYQANFQAASALLNTHISACCGGMTWMILARYETGKWPFSGVINGIFAGLAAITAGSGYSPAQTAFATGILGAIAGYFTVKLRLRFGLDDVCEVIALQGSPGVVGALLNGFFVAEKHFACNKWTQPECCSPEGSGCGENGVFANGDWTLVYKQLVGVLLGAGWSFFWTFLIMLFIKYTVGIDVSPDPEEKGLDMTQIGEHAYDHDLADKGEVYSAVSKEILANDAEKLNVAAREGDLVQLHRLLLFSHVSAKSVTFELRSAAHVAAANNHLEFLKELHRFGCPLDGVDKFGSTPLLEAIRAGSDDVIAWLISKGVSANTMSVPSQILMRAGNDNTTVEQQAEEQFRDQMTNSLVEQFFEAASSGDAPTMRRLLAAAVVDVNVADYDGRTALHICSAEGFAGCLELLLSAGAKPIVFDRWGHTPADEAKAEGFDDCFDILKKAAPKVDEKEITRLRRKHIQQKHGGGGEDELEQTMKRNATDMVMMASMHFAPEDLQFYQSGDFALPMNHENNASSISALHTREDTTVFPGTDSSEQSPLLSNLKSDFNPRSSLRKSQQSGGIRASFALAGTTNNGSAINAMELLDQQQKHARPKPRKAQVKERMRLLLEKKNQIDKNARESHAAAAAAATTSYGSDNNNNNINSSTNISPRISVREQMRRSMNPPQSYGSINNANPSEELVSQGKLPATSASSPPTSSGGGLGIFQTATNLLFRNNKNSSSSNNQDDTDEGKSNTPTRPAGHRRTRSDVPILEKKSNSFLSTPRQKSFAPPLPSNPNDKQLEEAAAELAGVRELSAACSNANMKEVKRLLKKGVDPTSQDLDTGRCALHIAAAVGNVDIMRLLLKSDEHCNVNVLDKWQNTPLSEAMKNDNPKTAELIRAAGGSVVQRKLGYALCKAAADNKLEVLLKMHERGVDITACDYDNRSCLHLAASEGHVEIVRWLLSLEDGFRHHCSPADRFGNSPLLDAIRERHADVFNLLTEAMDRIQVEQEEFNRLNPPKVDPSNFTATSFNHSVQSSLSRDENDKDAAGSIECATRHNTSGSVDSGGADNKKSKQQQQHAADDDDSHYHHDDDDDDENGDTSESLVSAAKSVRIKSSKNLKDLKELAKTNK